MDNNIIRADINDIRCKKKMIEQKYHELLEIIKEYRKMVLETQNIYNTESARYFRNVVLNYMDIVPIKLDNEFMAYVNNLDDIVEKYSEMYLEIEKMINSPDIFGKDELL